MTEPTQIYIFRHGDRTANLAETFRASLTGNGSEPDLSPTGRNQAENLRIWVSRGTLPKPSRLWVSPKLRAQNSFRPLSESLNLPLEIYKELDERSGRETQKDFRDRVARFLQKAAHSKSGVLFLCSHYDWLEDAAAWIPANEELPIDGNPLWSPGSYVGFEIVDEVWNLKQKGQLQTW